jgi:predicted alpha/beta-fold hydrolase
MGPQRAREDGLSLEGHLWTIGSRARDGLFPPHAPPSRPWSRTFCDADAGDVTLTGLLSDAPGADRLVVIVHGLGGSCTSHYAVRAAWEARRAGAASLRLNLRGADGGGNDFYHAGLTADLREAFSSPEVRKFARVCVLGYSLGGHLALRLAADSAPSSLVSVAAVCAPLDLDRCAASIDRPALWPYRLYLLSGLKRIYEAVARRRPVPLPPSEARKIRTIRRWDDLIVAPRHHFKSAEDYYRRESAGPRLKALKVPSLLIAAQADPLVPSESLLPFLGPGPPTLDMRWVARGGHVGFPRSLDLSLAGAAGSIESQVMAWFAAAGPGGARTT